MNRIFKVLKNRNGESSAVSELAKGCGKSKTLKVIAIASLLGLSASAVADPGIYANGTSQTAVDGTKYNSSGGFGGTIFRAGSNGSITGGDDITVIYDVDTLGHTSGGTAISVSRSSVVLGNNTSVSIKGGAWGASNPNSFVAISGTGLSATAMTNVSIGDNSTISADSNASGAIFTTWTNLSIGANSVIQSDVAANETGRTSRGYALYTNSSNVTLGDKSFVNGANAIYFNKGTMTANNLTINAKHNAITLIGGTSLTTYDEPDSLVYLTNPTVNFNGTNGTIFAANSSSNGLVHENGASGGPHKGTLHIVNGIVNNLGGSSNAIIGVTETGASARSHNVYFIFENTTINANGSDLVNIKKAQNGNDTASSGSTIGLTLDNSTVNDSGGIKNGQDGSLTVTLENGTQLDADSSNTANGNLELNVDTNSSLNGNVTGNAVGDTTVNLSNGGTWSGSADDKTNANIGDGSTWFVTDSPSSTIGNVNNGGTIDLGKGSSTTVLTIDGDYHGDGGSLNIYTDVDKGQSDKLVINGNADGNTNLNLTDIGNGTSDGGSITDIIDIIGTDNGSIWNVIDDPNSSYDYSISTDANGKLVLSYSNAFSSALNSPVAGSVFGNQIAASNMFRHNIHDRDTSVYVPDTNVWMRYNFNRTQTDLLNGAQSVDIKTSVVEIGVDLISQEQFKAGIYGGYGHSTNNTSVKNNNRKGDGSVSGYNLGIYGTWNEQANGAGAYVDTWAQYSWFDNDMTVKLSDVRKFSESYDGKAITISAETGYGFIVGQDDNKNWLLEPHLQLGYTWADSDDFKLGAKGKITDVSSDGAQVRLGARFYGQSTKDGFGILPFIEANWLYDSATPEAKINSKKVDSDMTKNFGELKVGVNGKLTNELSSFAQLDGRFGKDDYKRIGVQVGMNYSF